MEPNDIKVENSKEIISNIFQEDIKNPFIEKKQEMKTKIVENTLKFNKIEFDENGFVIMEDSKKIQQEIEKNIPKIEFDENGFVISMTENNNNTNQVEEEKEPIFKFDENGRVISIG